jgi:ABC-type transport system involved in multi-copper enzyme maturation permease subunit
MQPADGIVLPVRPGKIGISRFMAALQILLATSVFSMAFFAMTILGGGKTEDQSRLLRRFGFQYC